MPSRKIPAKPRRTWRMSDLSPSDMLDLVCGWAPDPEDTLTAFRSVEDVQAAWETLREHFLVMEMWDAGPEVDVLAAHRPGQRPWAWWTFDANREMPRFQPPVLKRLGLLSEDEEREIKVWDKEVRKIGYKGLRDYYSRGEEDS